MGFSEVGGHVETDFWVKSRVSRPERQFYMYNNLSAMIYG
jgi:hypothetical protein